MWLLSLVAAAIVMKPVGGKGSNDFVCAQHTIVTGARGLKSAPPCSEHTGTSYLNCLVPSEDFKGNTRRSTDRCIMLHVCMFVRKTKQKNK